MRVPARCSPRSRSTSVMGIRASRPSCTAAILPSFTHRRTVSGCKPGRLATSPERSMRVFSVRITRIYYSKYANSSTADHPGFPGDAKLRPEHYSRAVRPGGAARTLDPCLGSAVFQQSGAFLLRGRECCRHHHPAGPFAAATRTGTSRKERAAKASSEQRTAESAQTRVTLVDGLADQHVFSFGDGFSQLDRHRGQPERHCEPGRRRPCRCSFLYRANC